MCPMPTAPVYTLRTYSENFQSFLALYRRLHVVIFTSFVTYTSCYQMLEFDSSFSLISKLLRDMRTAFCHLDWQPNPDYHWLGYHQFLFKLPSLFWQLDLLVLSIQHYKNSCTLLFPCQSHYENLVNKNVYIHVKCCSLTVYRADCCPYCEHTRPPDTQSNHRAVRQLPVTKSMHSVE